MRRPPPTLLRVLERLWGIESNAFKPLMDTLVWIERPRGFVVSEPPPLTGPNGSWAVYLVERVGLDTLRAARILAHRLGAEGYTVQGLKDSCAIAYQYMAFRRPRETLASLTAGGLRAWLLGRRSSPLRPGGHGFNFFRLEVRLEDPALAPSLCRILCRVRWLPGFYGPQRFGIERPNTHIYGLLRLRGEYGSLIAEYATRYPLESPARPGDYESKAIELARLDASPLAARGVGPARIHLEALQAYIFNRTLSKALSRGFDIHSLATSRIPVTCPTGRVWAPAAYLPPRALSAGGAWAGLVKSVMVEEGLDPGLLSPLPSPRRPLAFPICRLDCRPSESGARILVALPSGAYATILLRAVGWVDWLKYSACHPA